MVVERFSIVVFLNILVNIIPAKTAPSSSNPPPDNWIPLCHFCISKLFVFGDSISDNGLPNGLWTYNNQSWPLRSLGFYEGRFTNGLGEATTTHSTMSH